MPFAQAMREVHLRVLKNAPLLRISVTAGRMVQKFHVWLDYGTHQLSTSFAQVIGWRSQIVACKRANRFSMSREQWVELCVMKIGVRLGLIGLLILATRCILNM